MSRTRPVDGPTISLFPFLAVLLCTMGALLVLLVLFSRSATHGKHAEAEADVAELELAKENLAWRLEQLRGVRDRTAEDLAKARLQLAGTEEHARELSDELAKLERMHAELAGGAGSGKTADAELAALEAKLKSARESLDKSRAELATKPPAYAVVPYVGVNGTHRRPLYIECSLDGVFLQPEGIRLNPSDFEGPPGPGNPLASALRAAREHIAKSSTAAGDPAAQPYPLLLVRPSGVMAYYAAREAIQSWGSEFGYQLVDEEWTLQFPPRDPTLAEVEKRAIEESRQRLEWLAQVRPARPARPVQQFRAATTRGGVVAEGGPSVLGDQSRFNWTNQQAENGGRGGAGGAAGGSGFGNGEPQTGATGGSAAGRVGPGRPLAAGGSADGSFDSEGTGTGDAILGGAGSGSDNGLAAAGAAGAAGGSGRGRGGRSLAGGSLAAVGGGDGSGGQSAGSGAAAGDGGVGDGAGGDVAGGDRYSGTSRFASTRGSARGNGSAESGSETGGATNSATGSTAGAASGGGSGSSNGSSSTSSTASSSGGAGGGSMGMANAGGPAMPGLMQSGGSAAGQAGASGAAASASLAQARGKNWASLATQDRPIPLTRPIRLECAVDEFRILDDSGRRVQTRIPVGGDTAEAIDPLVKAIHSRVDAWGLAGERMYWKPQLVLSATADGRSRRDDLERLLADSGLDTRQHGSDDEIRSLPPVRRTSYVTSEP